MLKHHVFFFKLCGVLFKHHSKVLTIGELRCIEKTLNLFLMIFLLNFLPKSVNQVMCVWVFFGRIPFIINAAIVALLPTTHSH